MEYGSSPALTRMAKLTQTPGDRQLLANGFTMEWFNKTYLCEFCDTKTTSPEKMSYHKLNSHGFTFCDAFCADHVRCPRLWICPCGQRMNDSKALIRHIISTHLKGEIDELSIRRYLCGRVGQGVEAVKRNTLVAQHRQFMLAHSPTQKLKTLALQQFSQDKVRLFHKGKQTRSVAVKFYGVDKVFIVNPHENNEAFERFMGLCLARGYATLQPRAQMFDVPITLLNTNLTIDMDAVTKYGATIGGLVLLFVACLRAKSQRALIVSAICCLAMASKDLRTSLYDSMMRIFSCTERRGQGPDKGLVVAVATALMILVFGCRPSGTSLDNLVKQANNFGVFSKNLTVSMALVEKLYDFFMQTGLGTLLGLPTGKEDLELLLEKIVDFRTRIADLEANQASFAKDPEICKKAIDLEAEYQMFYGSLRPAALPQAAVLSLTNTQIRVVNMAKMARESGALASGGRVEPVVLCFHGASGIGKSHVAIFFAAKLAKIFKPDADKWQREVYVRNVNQEFWDNYHEQTVVLYDDFGQKVDSVAAPNEEFIELIKSQNYTDYPLHMASIQDKSNTYFKSKAIILTTNLPLGNIPTKSLQSTTALNRRIELAYKVTRKAPMEGEIHPTDYKYTTVKGKVLTADEVLKEMVDLMHVKEHRYRHIDTTLNSMSADVTFGDVGLPAPDPAVEVAAEAREFVDEGAVQRASDVLATSVPQAQGWARFWENFWTPPAYSIVDELRYAQEGGIATTDVTVLVNYVRPDEIFPVKVGALVPVTWYCAAVPRPHDWPGKYYVSNRSALGSLEVWIRRLMRLYGLFKIVQFGLSIGNIIFKRPTVVRDSSHSGLTIGEVVKHKHICSVCEDEYEHQHEIKTAHRPAICSSCSGNMNVSHPNWDLEFAEGVEVEQTAIYHPTDRGFGPIREKDMLIDQGNNIEGTEDFPELRRVEKYDAGRTSFPRKTEKYDAGKTSFPRASQKKPEGPVAQTSQCASCDAVVDALLTYCRKCDPWKPEQKIICDELKKALKDFSPETFVKNPSREFLEREDGVPPSPLEMNYREGSERQRAVWRQYFGAEHFRHVERHIDYVVAAWDSSNFVNSNRAQIEAHDYSKYSLIEVAGYTGMWHADQDVPFFSDFTEEERATLWKMAWKHHKHNNAHHPDVLEMTDADLEEAVCDMISMTMLKKLETDVPPPQSTWRDHIYSDDGRYMARFCDDQKKRIDELLSPKAEQLIDHNARQVTVNVQKNLFMIFGSDDEINWTRNVNLFFIEGTFAMTVAHAIPTIRAWEWIKLVRSDGKTYYCETNRITFRRFKLEVSEDVALLQFPREFPDFPSMRKHFIKKNDIPKVATTPATLVSLAVAPDNTVAATWFVTNASLRHNVTYYSDNVSGGIDEYYLATCWAYRAETSAGDCGSVLVCSNSAVIGKLMGFHSWGGDNRDAGSILVSFEDMEKMMKIATRVGQGAPMQPGLPSKFVDTTMFYPAGQVKKPGAATKTAIEKSVLHDTYTESFTMPAQLRGFKGVDPMAIGRCKLDNNATPVSNKIIESAKADVEQIILSGADKDRYNRVLTVDEAVAGVPSMPNANSVNRTTAAGYPYCLEKGAKGKKTFIDDDFVLRSDVRKDVEERVAKAKQGIRTQTIWTDTLKDERRPKEKVLQGKTRVFTASPLDFTLALRMFTLGFCAFVMANAVSNGIAVGINPYEQWDILAGHLRRKGDGLVAGDFQSYDGVMRADIMHACFDIVDKFYANDTSEERLARRTLFREIFNSMHVGPDGYLYYDDHGMPSGCSLTAILNSLYNMLLMRVNWMKLGQPIEEFRPNVSEIYFGDDNALNITRSALEVFNQHTITETFAKMGIVYTSEDKCSTPPKWRALSEITFLKRAFVYEPSLLETIAPLDLKVILEIPMWTKTKLNVDAQVADNVETALRELALHPKHVFDEWSAKIQASCLKYCRIQPVFQSREYLLEEVTGRKPSTGQEEITVIDLQQSLREGGGVKWAQSVARFDRNTPLKYTKRDPVLGPDGVTLPQEEVTTCVAATEKEIGKVYDPVTEEIVTFDDEQTPLVNDEVVEEVPENTPYREARIHGLTDILARPYLVKEFQWKDSDAAGAKIADFSVKARLKAQPNFRAKLSNFAFWRANFRLRIMINTQRFQVGKLMVCAMPIRNSDPFPSTDPIVLKWQRSTTRHIELDAGTGEQGILELPFFNDADVWTVDDDRVDWRIEIIVLNPLQGSTNAQNVDGSVFINAFDVEPTMPAVASATMLRAQGVEGKKKSSEGLVSGPAQMVSKVAGALSGVPFLSDIAGPVSWIASAVGKVASGFGFSNPVSQESTKPMTVIPARGFTHIEGLDTVTSMSFCPDNEVEQLKEEDDQQFTTITRRYGLISTHDWSFADEVGTNLTSWFVDPIFATDVNPKWRITSPLSWVARLFKLWHGSITYRVSFAKNQFYSGKLLVTFRPHSVLEPTMDESNDLYREVLVLKDANDFEITIPYVSNTIWRKVLEVGTPETSTGIVTLTVLQRLQSADTVPDTIQFNVWHSSNDMLFSAPVATVPDTSFSSFDPDAREESLGATKTLSPLELPASTVRVGQGVAPANTGYPTIIELFKMGPQGTPETTTIGERVTSLRQLMRRYTPMALPLSSLTVASWIPMSKVAPPQTPAIPAPYFSYLATPFRFLRGGLNWRMWSPIGELLFAQQINGVDPMVEGAPVSLEFTAGTDSFVPRQVNPEIGVKMPFYSMTPRRFIGDGVTYPDIQVVNMGAMTATGSVDDTTNKHVYIAGADDSTFSMWIGSPLVRIPDA